jgi:hypothetical protein
VAVRRVDREEVDTGGDQRLGTVLTLGADPDSGGAQQSPTVVLRRRGYLRTFSMSLKVNIPVSWRLSGSTIGSFSTRWACIRSRAWSSVVPGMAVTSPSDVM